VKESLGTLQEFSLGQKVLERRLFCSKYWVRHDGASSVLYRRFAREALGLGLEISWSRSGLQSGVVDKIFQS